MKSKLRFLVLLMPILVCMAHAQTPASKSPATRRMPQKLTVPEPVAHLIRPLLDLRQKSQRPEINCPADADPTKCTDSNDDFENNFEELLAKLSGRKDSVSDEALVVLMCFYLGESQEETDAVIGRGRRMLRYLNKYRYVTPHIPGRSYPGSMFKDHSVKADDFAGAIRAIQKGLRSTAENPEG
jgi:hypothetical protein